MKSFYIKWFEGGCGKRYDNPTKGFSSYFISFKTGCKLELMTKIDVTEQAYQPFIGLNHIAFSLQSPENVDGLTNQMRESGVTIISEPRRTGDGFYESVISDPEGNKIELTE